MTDQERHELAELRATLSAMEDSIRRLGERVRALETEAGPAAAPSRAAFPPSAGAPAEPGGAGAPPGDRRRPTIHPSAFFRRRPPPAPPAPVRWLRAFLAEGNPLNKLGALSLIVGSAIVFKYAVDSGWIGPTGRVALGLVTGTALLGLGEVYARRGWHRFASGLVAAGDGLLFVAVWFGHQQYQVIPAAVAFGLYVVVTAAVVAQSLRYAALGLAVWGLLGGYLAPALASTGSGDFAFLSTYLLVLNGGVFAIAYRRDWQPLKWMAFVLTVAYTGTWVYEFAEHPGRTRWLELHWLLPYLAAFFVSFAAIPTWRSLRLRAPIDAFGQALTVANGVVHFLFAAVALHEQHRAWLGLVAAVVAVLYAVVSSRMVRQPRVDAPGLRVFTATAAGFLLLATPYLASGPVITLVWCAQTILLAWVCTQPRFAFLRLHVLAMLGIILIRLVEFDGLLAARWAAGEERYLPFAELRSWPPFAAALSFGVVARLVGRMPSLSFPVGWVMAAGLLVLVAAVDAEAQHAARHLLAPRGSGELHQLIRAGLLVAVTCALWFGAVARLAAGALLWTAALTLAAALVFWTFEALVWPGGYGGMRRILGDGYGLWWLHGGVLLMAPLLVLLGWLAREAPAQALRMSRERLQTLLLGVALLLAMLLLRREAFAITHAPPCADLLSEGARRASYRTILSLSYALLAFGVYLSAIRTGVRARLHAAYALYLFTAFKVYVFDLESQNQLYRAFSLLVFAAILFVSSYFANRQQRSQHD
jgi:uncharacterized membrane protein